MATMKQLMQQLSKQNQKWCEATDMVIKLVADCAKTRNAILSLAVKQKEKAKTEIERAFWNIYEGEATHNLNTSRTTTTVAAGYAKSFAKDFKSMKKAIADEVAAAQKKLADEKKAALDAKKAEAAKKKADAKTAATAKKASAKKAGKTLVTAIKKSTALKAKTPSRAKEVSTKKAVDKSPPAETKTTLEESIDKVKKASEKTVTSPPTPVPETGPSLADILGPPAVS